MSQPTQAPASNETTTTNPSTTQIQLANPTHSQTATRQQDSPLLVARILAMTLQNGIALASHRPRPYAIILVNVLRSRLLRDPFFDEQDRPDELTVRARPARILFMDVVVLLARLMRVLMRQNPLGEDETSERLAVRNACLDQPFFQRGKANSARPFTDDEFEDEAVVV